VGILFCSTAPLKAQTLTLATAANFRDPMSEIVKLFTKENPSIEVKTIFGSSGNLYNQITNSAPFDIYYSANLKYPQKLYEAGLTYQQPAVYAIGQLVMWSRRMDVSTGLEILQRKEVKRIAIANPELAPYGLSAQQCLKHFGSWNELSPKIVTAENIAQTAQFAVTGNADVAFIAKSQLNMKAIRGKGTSYEIDTETYDPIYQGFVCIKKEGNKALAEKFVAFMQKAEIQQLIKHYGYMTQSNE